MNLRRPPLLAAILLSVATSGAQTLNPVVAGVRRSTILYAPSGISHPALVLVLHGLGGNGAGMRSSTQMDKVADREKFVVAYPDAVGGTWDYAGAKNDYAFLKAIIDSAVARHGVDRDRVYLTGFSQGGGEAVYAALNAPDVYAAVAPVSSVGSGAPTPKRPIPILLTFGTKDLYTPATFMASVASWLKFDSCRTEPVATRPYPSTNTKSTVTRLAYGGCAQGTEIVVDSIQGGGHEWPNNTATKVNNAEEVWAFFRKFTLRRGTSGVPERASSTPVAVFCHGRTVHLTGVRDPARVRVLDTRGRPLATAIATEGSFELPRTLAGFFLLDIESDRAHHYARLTAP